MNRDPYQFDGHVVRPRWFHQQWRLAGNPAVFFDRLSQQHGDFVHYRGLFQFYLVNHPALVKQVLQGTHRSFDKRSVIYDRFRNAFGDGLVVAEGGKWKRQRRLMQPMLGPSAVDGYVETMVDATNRMLQRWEVEYANEKVFDISKEMNRITLEIAGRSLFGGSFDDVADSIQHWTETINHYSAKPPLPVIRSFWFPSRLNRKLKSSLREFHQFIRHLITERRAASKTERSAKTDGSAKICGSGKTRGSGTSGSRATDLLDTLLDARHEDDEEPMSDGEVAEEVLGMMIGAHETSSSALTWVWHELFHHPDVIKQLHQEVDSLQDDGGLSTLAISKLRYCKMVIDETMRLHPPFWFENRNVREEVELGGVTLPKGSLVVFSRYSLHRHPAFWDDPEQFDPNRFTPGEEENARSSYAYVPFGGGPRICIGIHLAIVELVIIVAMIAQRFEVVVDQSDRHEMAAHLTMAPRRGLRVRLRPR